MLSSRHADPALRAIALLALLAQACSDDAAPRDATPQVLEQAALPDRAPSTPQPIGGACGKDSDCQDQRCLLQRGTGVFPGGYCSKACDSITLPCPTGSSCAGTVDGDCFKVCTLASDCRDGYSCKDGPGGPPKICFP